MQVYLNDELSCAYLANLDAFLDGKRGLPALKLQRDDSKVHKSDILGGICRAYFKKTAKSSPPRDKKSTLNFSMGRAFEHVIAFEGELEPRDKGLITTTADDRWNNELVEIKYTKETVELFDPKTSHPEWVKGMMAECSAFDTNRHHLLVGFAAGNLQSKTFFGSKLHKEAGIPQLKEWINTDLRGWTFDFDDYELSENFTWLEDMAMDLDTCIAMDTFPTHEFVQETMGDNTWWCKNCDWRGVCDYYDEYVREV